jgi:hypothetical protein
LSQEVITAKEKQLILELAKKRRRRLNILLQSRKLWESVCEMNAPATGLLSCQGAALLAAISTALLLLRNLANYISLPLKWRPVPCSSDENVCSWAVNGGHRNMIDA